MCLWYNADRPGRVAQRSLKWDQEMQANRVFPARGEGGASSRDAAGKPHELSPRGGGRMNHDG